MADNDGAADDEPFFQRWSRRKQSAKTVPPATAAGAVAAQPAAQRHDAAEARTTATFTEPVGAEPVAAAQVEADTGAPAAQKPLTEADFADVDFDQLDYHSDYGRFTGSGVPETIRQKALTKLWHSDPMFTQVDPFQDYAGDYTDAATVPVGGIVRTAYKVGQGFLTDDEAHVWDRLGKPEVAADIAALPVLRPGFRVRAATAADAAELVAVQQAAIHGQGAEAYGAAIAASWATDLQGAAFIAAVRDGEHLEVAVQEDSGQIVGFCGTLGPEIKALFVSPRHTRKAIATRLLARAEQALLARGRRSVALVATLGARALYERHGYVLQAERMMATRGGLDMPVFDMHKRLIQRDDVVLAPETPDQPEIRAFFAASEAYMGALYPAESNHFVDAAALAQPHVIFLVARTQGAAIGCGAVVKADDGTAEIKRMWLEPAARGLKLGSRLLAALEAAARADGIHTLQLETGNAQPEALGLYRRAGFVEIGPFGGYQPDPLSVFMAKPLT
jgi:putative acetyltransferase